MKSKIVASREYKVMLRAAKFEQADVPHEGAKAFWTWLTAAAKKVGAKAEGALTKVDKRRQVRFYDTEDCFLRRSGYVLRERRKLNKGKKRQFTLKYRHPDRFIAQARRMKPTKSAKGKPKFEEDIKGLFEKPYLSSLYSFSSKIQVEEPLEKLRAPVGYFGDLGKRLGKHDPKASLVSVGDFAARETVLVGGFLELGSIIAECALVVWHDASPEKAAKPEIVEFSFRYENEVGELRGVVSRPRSAFFDRCRHKPRRTNGSIRARRRRRPSSTTKRNATSRLTSSTNGHDRSAKTLLGIARQERVPRGPCA